MLQPNAATSTASDVIDTSKAFHKHEQILGCCDWVWVKEFRCFTSQSTLGTLILPSAQTCWSFWPQIWHLATFMRQKIDTYESRPPDWGPQAQMKTRSWVNEATCGHQIGASHWAGEFGNLWIWNKPLGLTFLAGAADKRRKRRDGPHS